MNKFISSIEVALDPFAQKLPPKGSDVRAVIHQWIHAICSKTDTHGTAKKVDLIKALKEAGLYTSEAAFKKLVYNEINFPPPQTHKFKFIDLFAGIGGFRLALQEMNGVCVFSSEWDSAAQKTYLNNYGELPFGDITPFTSDEVTDEQLDSLIPDHDILAGGFPCQPFSHAGVSARNAVGKQHGFKCDTQGTLFFDIMRIVSVKKPKVLFLENVSNIQRHDGGKTFTVIKASIEELGYDFKYEIIDS
ncbi:MAG: DNA (cytosine-5)-methyltransferase 1 [Bradyrhizobium sp.]|jgi:DNA (cytosine-5)-methyltransferase 1